MMLASGSGALNGTQETRWPRRVLREEVVSPRFGQKTASDSFYSIRLAHAIAFAAEVHQNQFRAGSKVPYLAHLLGVTSNVMKFSEFAPQGLVPQERYLEAGISLANGDLVNISLEDAVIAALLHDAIEDQGGDAMKRQIRTRFDDAGFPPVVAMLVDYCTTYDQESLGYNEYKRVYLERVADPTTPATVLLISGGDKLDNLRDMLREYQQEGEAFWDKFKHSKAEKLEYNRDIVRIFKASGKYPELVAEIERVQQAIERHAKKTLGLKIRQWVKAHMSV